MMFTQKVISFSDVILFSNENWNIESAGKSLFVIDNRRKSITIPEVVGGRVLFNNKHIPPYIRDKVVTALRWRAQAA